MKMFSFWVWHGLPDESAECYVLPQRMCKVHQNGVGSKNGQLVLMDGKRTSQGWGGIQMTMGTRGTGSGDWECI
jgi:hypothetical protein